MAFSIRSPQLPIIDLSLFESSDPSRDHAATQIDRAASEFGCFYVVGHGVEQEVMDSLVRLSHVFFERQSDMRAWPYVLEGSRRRRSYLAVTGNAALGADILPDLPGFRDVAADYIRAMTGLAHKLMTSIGRGLCVGDSYFVDSYTGNPATVLRIFNHLPGQAYTDLRDEHADHGLLTLIPQDGVVSLQVKHRAAWMDVPHVPGAFIVHVGGMLERLSAGRYISPEHRLANFVRLTHISIPFFFGARPGAVLQPVADASIHGTSEDRACVRAYTVR